MLPSEEGWIEWTNTHGKPPCDPETIVQAHMRNGGTVEAPAKAIDWIRLRDLTDVVCWRPKPEVV